MENGKEVEVCKSVVKVCMDRLRRIDPQYGYEPFFRMVVKYPTVVQALYDAEYCRITRTDTRHACGVDSQQNSDADVIPATLPDIEQQFKKWQPKPLNGLFMDIVSCVYDVVAHYEDIMRVELWPSVKYLDQANVVVQTRDNVVVLGFWVELDEIHFHSLSVAPHHKKLEQQLLGTLMEECGVRPQFQ